jgi:hypothetical protein
MSDFAPKQRPSARSRIARATTSPQNLKRPLHSVIGNRAMQRLLQREGQDEVKDVPYNEFQASVISAVNTLGGAVTADYVPEATDKGKGLLTAMLRIGKRSHRLMPAFDKMVALMNGGKTKPGTLEGTAQLVYIKLQSLPGRSRITCKLVDVETSTVLAAGKHDFDNSPQAMTEAIMHALVQMGVPWVQSKEPYTGSVSDI